MTLFFLNLLGDYCNPQHRVTSIATAFGPPNFQMEITPLHRMKEVCGATSHMMKDELIVGEHQVDG